ISQ
ncbi:hypothetical protein D039_2443B, partial [Vibrio parahaemolyticus EKP-028]